MVTEIDEGRGLVKACWADIRKRVAKVEPTFAKIVDELSPDKTFPVYLVYLPYGALKGDTISSFLPDQEGGYYRLTDPTAPRDIIKNLSYGKTSSPLGMVLDKELEYFIDLKNEGITIPKAIYRPGSVFSFARNLTPNTNKSYSTNGILTVSSGSRSAFMLPNIGCAVHHSNLQRDLNIQSPPPKSLYEHWNIFKEISNSKIANCNWRSCIMYFSEKWISKLHSDASWFNLKLYLHQLAWQFFEFERSRFHYDIAFSIIQKKRNLKPNPYLADTARHLFTTALGAAPGYIPADCDDALPLHLIQKIFIESYGLKKYLPTILKPTHYQFDNDKEPIYYSLQNPSTYVFSPKSRTVSSTLLEMRELEHITRVFLEELACNKNEMCSGTILNKIANEVEFNYYHNKQDRHRVIKSSFEIQNVDQRFNNISYQNIPMDAKFASDARFVRGCISIRKKN